MKLYLLLLSLVWCFSCATNKVTTTEVIKLATSQKSWDGTLLPGYPGGTPEVTILRIKIPPKTVLDTHKHPVINAGVLLKGQLMVISENQDTLLLTAGDPIVELVDKWHVGVNNGSKPAEIIVFYAGVEGIPITILEQQ